jgi:hypothetical protein
LIMVNDSFPHSEYQSIIRRDDKFNARKWNNACNGGMDWIDLAHDRDQWRALVNTVMNLRVS